MGTMRIRYKGKFGIVEMDIDVSDFKNYKGYPKLAVRIKTTKGYLWDKEYDGK